MPLPAISFRILFVYNLLNKILLSLIPKKFISFLPPSWFHQKHHPDSRWTAPQQQSPVPISYAVQSHRKRMDTDELRRIFQIFDRNGDGRISKKELNDSLENMGISIPDTELTQMIEKIDVDGDGCVDIDEFGSLYQNIMDEHDEEDDMREAFNVFDQNGDGFISVDELKSVLASLGLKQGRTIEDCRQMIKKVDIDGDGMVNFAEFKQMMRGGGFAALS
ncbi:Calmodulin-like protein 3 [Datura stramonium]|uniref:Calmodulin-like protein 3 n=1 Tax=Datura stramonium TaxID=4076 RepID=A0ABS8SGS5_DATST|nr:Calmodulin-like protein 3 [Datura stramonium]